MIGNIFSLKRLFKKENGEEIVDLTQRSMQYNGEQIQIENTVMVTDKFKMRPDLISSSAYGSANDADLLMKWNGISNPFSIDVNDLIIVPSLSQMKRQLYEPVIVEIVEKPTVMKVLKNILKKEYNKRVKPALTPNQAEPGSKEILFKDGMIYFGPDVSGSVGNSVDPLAKTNFINKLK